MDFCLIESLACESLTNGFYLVGAPSFWSNPASWWAMAQVLIGLGAVIFVHELGHFLVAKACGVKCEKFYVGFDAFDIKIGDRVIVPRSLIKYQWGETEYGIGILPLGGYVKMLGQDDNPGNIEQEIQRSKLSDESGKAAADTFAQTGLVDRDQIDPRSFLAKSVLQRMAIISAGVIFNLIFAVLFAAFAFKSGVDYDPAMVGNVVGGGPAWVNNMAGVKPIRVGERTIEGSYYPYMDLAQDVIFHGNETPLEIEYVPYGETESKTVQVTPERGFLRFNMDLALIGVGRRSTPVIGEEGAIQGNAAAQADPPIQAKDVIVEINKTPIKTDIDLRHVLNRDSDLVAEMVLERTTGEGKSSSTETIRTSVAPNPARRVGFAVGWEPITAVQHGSPAEAAGILKGDEIVSIGGQPRGDLLTLDRRLIQIAREGGSVELELKRDGQPKTISLNPIVPAMLSDLGPNKPIGIDSLGVAIPMTRIVESIEPGSAAANSKMEVGDEIVAVTYRLSPEQMEFDWYAGLKKKPRVDLVEDQTTWAEISENLQTMEAGTELEFELKRGVQTEMASMKTTASEEFFQEKRGIALVGMKAHYVSETWSDALKYGYRQVINDIQRVGTTLLKLIKGKISPTNLGGPGTIALAATSEASQGTSRLLLFLTFLSANLAIVNFLPIPILDGGHMLFLAYEGIFRRPVSEKVQVILTYAGLAMILGLMLFVVSLDIGRIGSLLM